MPSTPRPASSTRTPAGASRPGPTSARPSFSASRASAASWPAGWLVAARRCDRPLAMGLGPAGSFAFAAAVLGFAGLAGLWVMVRLSRQLDGVGLLGGYAVLIALIIAIGR